LAAANYIAVEARDKCRPQLRAATMRSLISEAGNSYSLDEELHISQIGQMP
jgi:hypothetical protein